MFLLLIAAINLLVLRGVFNAFCRVKRGEPYDEQDFDQAPANRHHGPDLPTRAPAGGPKLENVRRRLSLRPRLRHGNGSGLLGISAAAATQGLPIWAILLFPALFTAGMCPVDPADGILMLGAYGWASVHPVRKLYYNMTITAISVLIAVLVGGIEVLGVIGGQFDLHGRFWT